MIFLIKFSSFVLFTGTRVTVEAFIAWKKKFDAEMRAAEKNKKLVRKNFSSVLNLEIYFF